MLAITLLAVLDIRVWPGSQANSAFDFLYWYVRRPVLVRTLTIFGEYLIVRTQPAVRTLPWYEWYVLYTLYWCVQYTST